jgi:site-specific recombinase XerD
MGMMSLRQGGAIMGYSKRRKNAAPTLPEKKTLTLQKALEAFLNAHGASGHSKFTLINYKGSVVRFLQYIADDRQSTIDQLKVDQIVEADMYSWLLHLQSVDSSRGKPYSSRTIQTYGRDVLVFLRWLAKHGYVDVDPAKNIHTPKAEKSLIRVFTDDELRLLDAACDRPLKGYSLTPDERKALAARDRAILWLLLSTGIRASELCGLLFSDIDWESGMIYVRGKGAKERKVPMGKVARQHLNTYLQYWRGVPAHSDDEHVFLTAFGVGLKVSGLKLVFNRLKRISGIVGKRVSAHTCRHWFAVNCIKRGMPTVALKGMLGHETWEMIEVYVHLAEQDNVTLYTQHSPVDALEMHQVLKSSRDQSREWRKAQRSKRK